MRQAFRNEQAWIAAKDGKGILVCLRTGRILATVARHGVGWESRTFISPIKLFWLWRHRQLGKPTLNSVEVNRCGVCFLRRHLDQRAVCQDAEYWSADD